MHRCSILSSYLMISVELQMLMHLARDIPLITSFCSYLTELVRTKTNCKKNLKFTCGVINLNANIWFFKLLICFVEDRSYDNQVNCQLKVIEFVKKSMALVHRNGHFFLLIHTRQDQGIRNRTFGW